MAALKEMTVVTSGKLRAPAYELLDAETNLLAWKEGGRTPAELFDSWLAQADALYSIGNIKINEELLAKAPKLKVIAQASVGYDNIDVAACHARGIKVGNTPHVLAPAVADLAYGLIIDSARKIARGWQHVATPANGANARAWALAWIWQAKRWALLAWATLAARLLNALWQAICVLFTTTGTAVRMTLLWARNM